MRQSFPPAGNQRRSRGAILALLLWAVLGGCLATRRTADPTDAVNSRGLHNVIRVSDRLISGSLPENDRGFDELDSLGVKTIISVDGATPDVARAAARGMRYVHVPVGYHGLSVAQQRRIARAARDLPGPIYLHCHHGKHRGPAAAASAAVLLGEMSPEAGDAFLKKAGTSSSYPGLFACVQSARALDAKELDATPPDFPAIAPRPAFVEAMSAAQDAFDHLVAIRDAQWRTPASHPDLVPTAEAARLESLLRGMLDDPAATGRPADFLPMLRASQQRAAELEVEIAAGAAADVLTAGLARLGATCRDCHTIYRDQR
ncbi:MAG: hypothetical protein AB7Q17_13110 [Phycisphaerae bacterium]